MIAIDSNDEDDETLARFMSSHIGNKMDLF